MAIEENEKRACLNISESGCDRESAQMLGKLPTQLLFLVSKYKNIRLRLLVLPTSEMER